VERHASGCWSFDQQPSTGLCIATCHSWLHVGRPMWKDFISVMGWFADKTFCWQCAALVTDFLSHSFVSFSYYQLLYCNTVVNCNTVVTEDYKRLMLLSCFNTWFITRFVLHLHDALLFVQCYAWTEYKFTCVCLSVCHTFSQLAYRSDPSTDFYSW